MEIVILGGGPGGYVAAIRAAQLGADVLLIEKENLGGTCLNKGCIPTKVLLHSAELYKTLLNESSELGILLKELEFDWNNLQIRKNKVVKKLVGGVESLLKSNKVKILRGKGSFINKNEIEVVFSDNKKEKVRFDNCIIATGSIPVIFPIPGIELENIVTSTEALSFEKIPKSLCIVGGGVIGAEFASVFSSLGTKVTIVEMLPNIVDNMDQEIVQFLANELIKSNVDILTNSKVESFEKASELIKVNISDKTGNKEIVVEKVLLSIGRKPNITNIGLEKIGVKFNKFIEVNKFMETNINHIYAIGDCNGGAMLAHVASSEGIVAVESIMNKNPKVDFKTIPYCVYTKPEIASVGMTEKMAVDKGYKIKIGRFPIYANGKALILGETEGIFKYVVDEETEEVLGLHIAGPRATELIVEGSLAIRLEATIDEIITTIHAHPTVGESLHEAALAVNNNSIHIPKSNK